MVNTEGNTRNDPLKGVQSPWKWAISLLYQWDGGWKIWWCDLKVWPVSHSLSKWSELRLIQGTKVGVKTHGLSLVFVSTFTWYIVLLYYVCLQNKSVSRYFIFIGVLLDDLLLFCFFSSFLNDMIQCIQVSIKMWKYKHEPRTTLLWVCWLTPPPISLQIFSHRETRPRCLISLGLVLQRRFSSQISQPRTKRR